MNALVTALLVLVAAVLVPLDALACPGCWPLVRDSVFDGSFLPRLLLVTAPFGVGAALLAAAHRSGLLETFGGTR